MKKVIVGLFAQAVQKLVEYNKHEAGNFDQMAADEGEPLNGSYDEDAAPGHVYHDIHALNEAYPVTLYKLMGDDDLLKSLQNLIAYNVEDEAQSFEEIFDIDTDGFTPDEILGVSLDLGLCSGRFLGVVNSFEHVYQTIVYIEDELRTAILKRSVFELGDAIEERYPRKIANLWLGIKKSMSL